jgi:hypothetical protein
MFVTAVGASEQVVAVAYENAADGAFGGRVVNFATPLSQ